MNHTSGTEIVQTNLLSKYFEKRINTFIKYFNSTKEHFGVEDLHKMRVEVKKLRAFFRLLELATEKSYQKAEHYKFLAKIFKPGGRLRQTQTT